MPIPYTYRGSNINYAQLYYAIIICSPHNAAGKVYSGLKSQDYAVTSKIYVSFVCHAKESMHLCIYSIDNCFSYLHTK